MSWELRGNSDEGSFHGEIKGKTGAFAAVRAVLLRLWLLDLVLIGGGRPLCCHLDTSLKGSFQVVLKMMSGEVHCFLKLPQLWVFPLALNHNVYF